jgi:hypothetical protein
VRWAWGPELSGLGHAEAGRHPVFEDWRPCTDALVPAEQQQSFLSFMPWAASAGRFYRPIFDNKKRPVTISSRFLTVSSHFLK